MEQGWREFAAFLIPRAAEKRPQQRGGRGELGRPFNRRQCGNKRPTVSEITATRLIVPN